MASRCVFVGNIPYDATEQALIELFSTAGPVATFRLVHDRDTGKPKGYGFCEYNDAATAQSAIRNLNNADFHGRALRVDFAQDDAATAAGAADGPMGGPPAPTPAEMALRQANLAKAQTEALIALAEKKNATPAPAAAAADAHDVDMTAAKEPEAKRKASRRVPSIIGSHIVPNKQITHSVEIISKLVQGLSRPQQLEILTEMKKFVSATPDAARQLLTDNPQVAQTVLQILVMYGFVRPADIQSLHVNKAADEAAANGLAQAEAEKQRLAQHAALKAQHDAAATEMLRQQQLLHAEAMRQQLAAQQQHAALLQQQQLLQQQSMLQQQQAQQQALMQQQQQTMPSLLSAGPGATAAPAGVSSAAAAPSSAVGVGGGGGSAAAVPGSIAAGATPEAIAAVASQLPPAQRQILHEVLKLSPEQIKQLPPQVQAQVYQLQQQLAMRR